MKDLTFSTHYFNYSHNLWHFNIHLCINLVEFEFNQKPLFVAFVLILTQIIHNPPYIQELILENYISFIIKSF